MSPLVVECRPDSERGPLPVRFSADGGRLEEVEQVIDCWPGEGHRYVRVRVHGGSEYILRHEPQADAWQIHFFLLRPGG